MDPRKEVAFRISHSEIVHASGIVHKGPCLVSGFSVAGYGAAGTADLYDGENAQGKHKCRISVLQNTTFHWCLTHPVDFDNGIYVAVAEDTTYVTICYIPESWRDFV